MIKPRQQTVTLYFRVFCRQNMDISHQFSTVESLLRNIYPTVVADPIDEHRRPCFFDEICAARSAGYLLDCWDGNYFYVIREGRYHISTDDAENLLKTIDAAFPNQFAAVKSEILYDTGIIAI